VAFSPDGSKIAAAYSDKIQIFDAQTQGKIGSPLNGHSRSVTSVAWNNDGTKLASGTKDKTVRIWSVGSAGTFECHSTLSGHCFSDSDYVLGVCFSPDGSNLVSCSRDGLIKIWNLITRSSRVCVSTSRSTCGHSKW